MENFPFEDVFPIGKGGFCIAMLVYRSVPSPETNISSEKWMVGIRSLPYWMAFSGASS